MHFFKFSNPCLIRSCPSIESPPLVYGKTADGSQHYCRPSAAVLQSIRSKTATHLHNDRHSSCPLHPTIPISKKIPPKKPLFSISAQFAITSITSAITCPKESNRQITNHLHYPRDSSDSKTDQNFFSYAASGFVYHHGTQFLDLPNHCLHSPTPCLMVKIQRPNNEKRKNDSWLFGTFTENHYFCNRNTAK